MKNASYYRMTVEEMVKYMAKLEREKYEIASKLKRANDQIRKQGAVINSLKAQREEDDYTKLMKSVEDVKVLVQKIENKHGSSKTDS